ncbi:hypothetical protein DH2020_042298 [Rehmannia glutinosa]|uniref:Protein kinase domain-containing protein n=1 Tax=Rehmannia glutinosa TaxID=99300 RepID=A0ABR0UMQ9_REHGL
MAPERDHKAPDDLDGDNEDGGVSDIDPGFKLMYLANEGDVDSIKELLDFGTDVNFRDIDYRTALHVSACQGYGDVAKLLLENGADVDPKDRWGSTMAPMHVRNAREVPEYEIDPRELDFTNSIELTKGDLHEYLKRKGALKPATALRFAMDIASNILRDDSGNLKVADFGVSKLLKVANGVREHRPLTCQDTACRYVAPEVFRNEEYDTKVDVFSFALILQELIEGCPPFYSKQDHEVPKSYVAKERPPFRASTKLYAHGLKELIEECWRENPSNRPTFKQIIPRLDAIYNRFAHRNIWKVIRLKCFRISDSKKGGSSLGTQRSSSRSTRSI